MRILIYISESFKIAFEALRAYKMRSVLTTLGIVIGVTTVITIVALIQGLNKSFANQLSAIGTTTLYIQKFPWIMNDKQFFAFRNRPNLKVEDAERLKSMSKLAVAVAPTLFTGKTTKYKERNLEGTFIVGTTTDYMETSNVIPEFGRFLSESDVNHRRPLCLIGSDVAEKLFPDEDPIGKRITVGGRRFKVIGVAEKKGSMFGQNLDQVIVIPIGIFQTAFGARFRSVDIEVKVARPEELDDAEIELTGIMRRIRGLTSDEEDNFSINKQSQLMETYKSLTSTLWAVAIGVGAISLLVGGIGIMNILLVSVTERTREIGIRKALGARRFDIMMQFLIESLMICAIGVAIGIALAIGVAKFIASTTPLPASITAWVAFLGLGFVLTIGLFFGIYPARKAARLNPIEALRYE
ncbi:FtsX-like permease family protein [candidate division KSB1 bacterium]|nr:ABC transporter permease [candidate division KSB1 bacterium]RQW06464.1 MAG: FtsX-like permease family protein [candidate division KSB1 bacterium]